MKLSAFAAIVILLHLSLADRGVAQPDYYNQWFLGDSLYLDFSSGSPLLGATDTTGYLGRAYICDPVTGDLLFYSIDTTIFNRNREPMPNGSTTRRPVNMYYLQAIVPAPGNPDLYYVFILGKTNPNLPDDSGIGLWYSIVDMRGDGGLGEVTTKDVHFSLHPSKQLCVVRHKDGCGYWIISYEIDTRQYAAWLLTQDGLAHEPVLSDVDLLPTFLPDTYLKASPNGRWLFAESPGGYYISYFEPRSLLKFDPSLGTVTRGPTLSAPNGHACFSPDNRYLYAATLDTIRSLDTGIVNRDTIITGIEHDGYDTLFQYDLTLPPERIEAERAIVTILPRNGKGYYAYNGWTSVSLGAMQIGSDGKIYVIRGYLVDTSPRFRVGVSVINKPNLPGAASDFQSPDSFLLPSGYYGSGTGIATYDHGLPYCIEGFLGETDAKDSYELVDLQVMDDTTVCRGRVKLWASGAKYYRWYPEDSIICNDCPSPIVEPHSTTSYYLEAYGDSGTCPRFDTVTVYVEGPPIADAGPDTIICSGSSTQLTASGGASYMWSPKTGLSCTDCPDPVASPLQSTSYVVTVSNSAGCSDLDTVQVGVVPNTLRATADVSRICRGEQVRLTAVGADEYLWSPSAGIDCPTCSTAIVSPDESTTYYVTGTGASGCKWIDSVVITVLDRPNVDAGRDTVICVGSSVELNGSGSGDLSWFPSDNLSCPTCPNPIATPTSTTTYRLLATSQEGCEAWDSVTVTLKQGAPIKAFGDTAFCPGGIAQLSVSGAERYEWQPAEGLDCTECSAPLARPESSTVYYVIGTNASGDCPAIDSVVITVHDAPVADAGIDTTICVGERIQLQADGGSRYEWDFAPELSCLECRSPELSVRATSTYVVTVFNEAGCSSRDSITVSALPPVVVDAGEDRAICAGESIQLNATGGVRWSWEPTAGLSCSDCPDPVAAPESDMEYHVVAWNDAGCSGSDTIHVTVQTEPDIVELRIGRDYHAFFGEPVTIAIEAPGTPIAGEIVELELHLSYDPRIMHVDISSFERLLAGTLLEGWDAQITTRTQGAITVILRAPDGTSLKENETEMLRFEARMYLAETLGTEIDFSLTAPGSCTQFITHPGYARIDSVCGLNLRLIELSMSRYAPAITYPNPAMDQVTFEFGLGLGDRTRLEVFDGLGHLIGVILDEHLEPGRFSVEWDVRNVPAGSYWYRLQSGGWEVTGQFEVRH